MDTYRNSEPPKYPLLYVNTYISRLNSKFNVITELQRISNTLGFREMEENFTNDISTFDKTKALFKGTHNPLVTNWVSRILQSDITSS